MAKAFQKWLKILWSNQCCTSWRSQHITTYHIDVKVTPSQSGYKWLLKVLQSAIPAPPTKACRDSWICHWGLWLPQNLTDSDLRFCWKRKTFTAISLMLAWPLQFHSSGSKEHKLFDKACADKSFLFLASFTARAVLATYVNTVAAQTLQSSREVDVRQTLIEIGSCQKRIKLVSMHIFGQSFCWSSCIHGIPWMYRLKIDGPKCMPSLKSKQFEMVLSLEDPNCKTTLKGDVQRNMLSMGGSSFWKQRVRNKSNQFKSSLKFL